MMYLLFLIMLFLVQFVFPYFDITQNFYAERDITGFGIIALSDTNSNTEELIYNGKVYFDEDYAVDESQNFDDVDKNTVIQQDLTIINNTDNNSHSDIINKIGENSETISTGEELDEEEIVFYDNFDTGYREELEEIWE